MTLNEKQKMDDIDAKIAELEREKSRIKKEGETRRMVGMRDAFVNAVSNHIEVTPKYAEYKRQLEDIIVQFESVEVTLTLKTKVTFDINNKASMVLLDCNGWEMDDEDNHLLFSVNESEEFTSKNAECQALVKQLLTRYRDFVRHVASTYPLHVEKKYHTDNRVLDEIISRSLLRTVRVSVPRW